MYRSCFLRICSSNLYLQRHLSWLPSLLRGYNRPQLKYIQTQGIWDISLYEVFGICIDVDIASGTVQDFSSLHIRAGIYQSKPILLQRKGIKFELKDILIRHLGNHLLNRVHDFCQDTDKGILVHSLLHYAVFCFFHVFLYNQRIFEVICRPLSILMQKLQSAFLIFLELSVLLDAG